MPKIRVSSPRDLCNNFKCDFKIFFSLAPLVDFPLLSFPHPPTAIDPDSVRRSKSTKKGTSNQIFKASLEYINYSVHQVRYYWRPFQMHRNLPRRGIREDELPSIGRCNRLKDHHSLSFWYHKLTMVSISHRSPVGLFKNGCQGPALKILIHIVWDRAQGTCILRSPLQVILVHTK